MTTWQLPIILFYSLFNALAFAKGFYESRIKHNAFGETRFLYPLGVFVWGDAVVISLFWTVSSVFSLLLNDWYLFLLIISVFWLVRSFGETIYWFNQQFSTLDRNPIKRLLWHSVFHDDSVWFAYQLVWQCVSVMSFITTLYLVKLWLQ